MKSIRILDGGMSRELVRLGAQLRQPEWSALALMQSPDIVRRAHEEFIAAGADVITTNSYALVPFYMGEERFRTDGRSLIGLAGRLAREAAEGAKDRRVLVAGSLPPIFGSYGWFPSAYQGDCRVHGSVRIEETADRFQRLITKLDGGPAARDDGVMLPRIPPPPLSARFWSVTSIDFSRIGSLSIRDTIGTNIVRSFPL